MRDKGAMPNRCLQHALYHCFRAKCQWSGRMVSSLSEELGLKSVVHQNVPAKKRQTHLPLLLGRITCLHLFESSALIRFSTIIGQQSSKNSHSIFPKHEMALYLLGKVPVRMMQEQSR